MVSGHDEPPPASEWAEQPVSELDSKPVDSEMQLVEQGK